MSVRTTAAVIRPTWRNLSQGKLPWLLRQKPVLDRLREVANITDQGREAAFTVWGHIDIYTKERYLSVSPVVIGEIFKVHEHYNPYDHAGMEPLEATCLEFQILDLHSHPNLGSGRSWFSPNDLQHTFRPALSWDPAYIPGIGIAGLFQISDKAKYGDFAPTTILDFVQATADLNQAALDNYRSIKSWEDARALYQKMGLLYEKFPFTYKQQNRYLGLHSIGQNLRQFKIWASRQKEKELIEGKHLEIKGYDDSMAEIMQHMEEGDDKKIEATTLEIMTRLDKIDELLSSLANGKSYQIEDEALLWHFQEKLEKRLAEWGFRDAPSTLEALGIRGQFVTAFCKTIFPALTNKKISPDFTVIVNGEEQRYWKKENPLFRELIAQNVAALLYRDELIARFKSLADLAPDVTISGPNGEQFSFFHSKTIRKTKQMDELEGANLAGQVARKYFGDEVDKFLGKKPK